MAEITRLEDVIQPEIFTPYTIQRTMELSELVQSGIVTNDAQFDSLVSGPNTLINMPFWNDLDGGESQVMQDEGDMNVNKITSSDDVARKQARVNAWGANGLSALLSGDDPMNAISQLVANYWTRDMQKNLLAGLSGVFKSNTMSSKVHDITDRDADAGTINMKTFLDATQLMGDAKESLTGVMMHSAVETELRKQDLIEYLPQSEQGLPIPYFNGKRVIVDDAMEYDTETGQASIYIFGQGAIALGNGSHPRIVPTEVDRNKRSYSGEEVLINRRIFLLHPRGVKWNEGGVSATFPTNGEIDAAARWTRVFDAKAIRVVKFRFNTVEQTSNGGDEG
ncbi:major capsid protein [Salicibibacter kimchii]|uniref:Coat protein n=1 Tax=Salicibibacter kimchii TaxID=2099786 RepID=A0A345BUI9_9BACI|nr:major capsid protein [Salicibibacter kimchii]AXF54620.1 coat protein [Salicibibacter kimchii]